MTPIRSRQDLQEACSQPRAFVFIWVDWAGQARHSKHAVETFARVWDDAAPGNAVSWYFVDLSEQCGEVWDAVREWLSGEGSLANALTYGGYGALLWVRGGGVVECAPYAARVDARELLAITRRVFGQP